MVDKAFEVSIDDLPFKAIVKYLGEHPAKGLWGIKNTRKPVDTLVGRAKNLPDGTIIPLVQLEVDLEGLSFTRVSAKKQPSTSVHFNIDSISYGVQDLVYTRVFSIIVVTDDNLNSGIPFICYSFVCDSRNQARQITYALAASFHEYGRKSQLEGTSRTKKFAIDLRPPEEQTNDSDDETDV